jgi:hypothetical protein
VPSGLQSLTHITLAGVMVDICSHLGLGICPTKKCEGV